MSLRAYWVNSADTSQIEDKDLNGRTLMWGTVAEPYTFLLPTVGYSTNPRAAENVYQAIEATYSYNRNYYGSPFLLFQPGGAGVGDDASKVQETPNPVSLLQLYNTKIAELNAYGLFVFNSPFTFDYQTWEFWVLNDTISLSARSSYNGSLANLIGQAYDALEKVLFDAIDAGKADPGGVNGEIAAFWNSLKAAQRPAAWWTRDLLAFMFKRSNLKKIVETLTKEQWLALSIAESTFNWQIRRAVDRVDTAINNAYGDGSGAAGGTEWQQLAAIDVQDDIAYNWPDHYVGPPELGTTGPETT